MKRRTLLKSLLAAPAVITTPGLLMPVKPVLADVNPFGFFDDLRVIPLDFWDPLPPVPLRPEWTKDG